MKIINEKNLNVSDISRRTGIPGTRIYKWLDGKGRPKVEDAGKIQLWAAENLEEIPNSKATANPSEAKGMHHQEPTPMQIFNLLARTLDSHGRILERMEGKMAQRDSQAIIEDAVKRIESNLTETLAGVEFVSGRQLQKILASLSELKAHKKGPSPDGRKKRRETGGDGHKSGIKP